MASLALIARLTSAALSWGKRQQACGELRAAIGRLADQLGDRGEASVVLDAIGQDLDRARDHGEHVVEVMGDAAGQLSDRFHLLGLDQLLFGDAALGDVADEGVDDVAVAAAT
jgi:hypothetical protein